MTDKAFGFAGGQVFNMPESRGGFAEEIVEAGVLIADKTPNLAEN